MTPAIPLAHWANGTLERLAGLSESKQISELTGEGLLGERAALGGFKVPGRVSAGGGCRMFETRNGVVALNLARPDDREMLPALFVSNAFDAADDNLVAAQMARSDGLLLTRRGREMGLAIASEVECNLDPSPAILALTAVPSPPCADRQPRVVDLSALWAGPLAAHLLWLAGAEVIKVESRNRPDAMRQGDPYFFALLNQGKARVALDLRETADRLALLGMLASADIVIESARPRALRQLGIHAAELVHQSPGQVWLSITGHGVEEPEGHWVGFGDDCGVAAGLAAAMRAATGAAGFVGDAIADPLTGIIAATCALESWRTGSGGHYGVSMRGVATMALASERKARPEAFRSELRAWREAEGTPFPAVPLRPVGKLSSPGYDRSVSIAC